MVLNYEKIRGNYEKIRVNYEKIRVNYEKIRVNYVVFIFVSYELYFNVSYLCIMLKIQPLILGRVDV